MIVTMRIYEKFLEAFDYSFPDEKRVMEKFENNHLVQLLEMVNVPDNSSGTLKLIKIKELYDGVVKALTVVDGMRKKLSIPEPSPDIPKIEFNMTNPPLDEAIAIRQVKKIMDEQGFIGEDGRSEYWETPLTSAFYIYFKRMGDK